MPFDWYCPKTNPAFQKKLAGRFEESALAEIEQRAHLLLNLRFPREAAVARIQRNIAWEFELTTLPKFAGKVREIVDRVYRSPK
jgi:hypothetical protein